MCWCPSVMFVNAAWQVIRSDVITLLFQVTVKYVGSDVCYKFRIILLTDIIIQDWIFSLLVWQFEHRSHKHRISITGRFQSVACLSQVISTCCCTHTHTHTLHCTELCFLVLKLKCLNEEKGSLALQSLCVHTLLSSFLHSVFSSIVSILVVLEESPTNLFQKCSPISLFHWQVKVSHQMKSVPGCFDFFPSSTFFP